VKAIEAGLLTCGSSYSPTPSQPSDGQWRVLLAFVPAYSGASVRDLHPLPVSSTSIARTANCDGKISSGAANVKHRVATAACGDQMSRKSRARIGGEIVIGDATAGVLVLASESSMNRAFRPDLIPALSRDTKPRAVMALGRSTPYQWTALGHAPEAIARWRFRASLGAIHVVWRGRA